MDTPLSVPMIARRGLALFQDRSVVSRRPDKTLSRTSYGEILARAGRLALALKSLGVRPGDRVATLAWNHSRHLEAYYAIPAMGAILHTLNLRLHPDDISYIANHADDRVVLVDKVLWPLWEKCATKVTPQHVVVMSDDGSVPPGTIDYEQLVASGGDGFSWDDVAEGEGAAMCYTSGTTGHPKGVLYSHRSLFLHAMSLGLDAVLGLTERDIVLPVVPMFHVNAWGLPFGCLMLGAAQVHPGPHLDAPSLLELLEGEGVTVTAGVPTIWLGILQQLDANPKKWDLSRVRQMVVGGSAAPAAMVRGFQERHGLRILHAWGMTETSPVGTIANLPPSVLARDLDTQFAYRVKQGRAAPMVEIRARGEQGLVPNDGVAMGELEVRGPWVAKAYYNPSESDERFTSDGWFKTGDIATLDADGFMTIQDRAKDLVKSGGEWISSVALEGALMGHPDIAEAAVVAVPHAKWDERPLAVVVMKEGKGFDEERYKAYLGASFAKWWIPDAIVQVAAIPKNPAGKFLKTAIREEFKGHYGVHSNAARGA